MDGAMPVQDSTTKTPTKGEHMAKVRLDSGTEFEVPEAIASHIDALTEDRKKLLKSEEEVTDAKQKIKDLEGEMDAKKGELDSLKTQVDAWAAKYEASGKDTAERIKKSVDSRVGLIVKAAEVGAKVEDAHSDRDIQLAIIALETADSMEGMSDDYVAARADSAYTHVKNHVPANEPGGNSHNDGVLTGAVNALTAAYRKRDDSLQNAWKREE
jgi:Skp family chaperone for outer membrane proteins